VKEFLLEIKIIKDTTNEISTMRSAVFKGVMDTAMQVRIARVVVIPFVTLTYKVSVS